MFSSKFFTATSVLTLVILLAVIAVQVLEMLEYQMF